ncbi:MAG: hypothetical protein J5I99_05855 [Verrucomicrobia bacterium]|nr:hypothetical protein [Verrucomicrobiota bacterium]
MSLPGNVSKDVRLLNPHLFPEPVAPVDRPMTKQDVKDAQSLKAEKELQQLCENYLVQRGYARLTADNAGRGERGYFGHLAKPIGNPLMPDLFVFDLHGRVLLIELKVRYVFQPGQREMIEAGIWKLCDSFNDVRETLNQWEET